MTQKAKNMTCELHKKNKNTLTGGSDFFAPTSFYDAKSTDCKAKSRNNGISLFSEPTIFGEAKSTDSRAMGPWTDARAHAHTDKF